MSPALISNLWPPMQLPVGNAMEAGHGGAPLGYVIPAFRGGGMKNDFALR